MVPRALLLILGFVLLNVCASKATAQERARVIKDVEFANVDGNSLKLDLYLPKETNPPLVVWIHGGGWQKGSKDRCPLQSLTENGYAVASISYRLTDKGKFPDQIHDCKGAIRWLRAHADKYGYSTKKIAVAGASAGGHLAALVGTSGGVEALEGTVGGNLDQSSRVDCVIDYFGPTDFLLRSRNQPNKVTEVDSPVYKLLGGRADELVELAEQASPVYHVTKDDPPLLAVHGDKDKTVFVGQTKRLIEAYDKDHLECGILIVPGAGHGGNVFFTGGVRKKVVKYLDQYLKDSPEN
ncbi:alpha/beta hydrolase fold domain-containing protein [bacterium]|nr:alpha/beta hydrolase fold domain-containing protein [bacterium]